MPVNVTRLSSKFFNKFINGGGFTANPTEFTTNLAGLIGEEIKLTQTINVGWLAVADNSDTWYFDAGQLYIERPTGNWFTDGFSVGDTWLLSQGYTLNRIAPVIAEGTITAISNDGKRIYITIIAGGIPQNVTDHALYGTTPLTALIYKFGLPENDDTFDFESKVSENDQVYYGSDIGFDTGGGVRDLNFVDMIPQGLYKDWVTGTMKVKYVQDVVFEQQFEIEHTFMIQPFVLEDQIDDITNGVQPDYLDGNASLKYAFDPEFRTVLSNPNTAKSNPQDNILGSVGGFGEAFNGFNNDYTVESIVYSELADPSNIFEAINLGVETKIDIVISTTGTLNLGDSVLAYITAIPIESEYQDKTTFLTENFIYDTALTTINGVITSGVDFISYFNVVKVGATIEIEIHVDYSSAQLIRMDDSLSYLVSIQVGDNALTAGNSNRVMELADIRTYVQDTDIPDLMTVTKLDLYPHDRTIGVDTGFTDLLQWNEDGFTVDGSFTIDLNKSAFVNNLELAIVAKNVITGEKFDLDSYAFKISDAVVSSGVQQLLSDTTRGYKLANDDQFNEVQLTLGANVGGIQTYNFIIGQKTPWQDWLENLNVDTVFFDAGEDEDNFNKKSSNYSDLNDYEIKVELRANLAGVSTLGKEANTNYFFQSPNLLINDYEVDGNITPVWSQVIETFNADTLAPLGDAVMSGTDTLMRITWTNSIGPVTNTNSFFAIHSIEIVEDKGSNIEQLSTLRPFPSNNTLKPLTGETQLKISAVAGKIITECIIDGTLIDETTNFSLSGRINDDIPTNAKIRTDLVPKETTTGQIKITAP